MIEIRRYLHEHKAVLARITRRGRQPAFLPRLPSPPITSGEWERLAPQVVPFGPSVIGGTGGSGTRVLARIVQQSGLFIGTYLNESSDARQVGWLLDRWVNAYASGRVREFAELSDRLAAETRDVLAALVTERRTSEQPWGWKEPRSIYLLPFFNELVPSMRFVHFVRDGRDMAFSTNQRQLWKHGAALLASDADEALPLKSIALWATVNGRAADYGERELGERYLRVRFEDLCAEPEATIESLLRFCGLRGDAKRLATEEVRPPRTIARWRTEDPDLVKVLEQTASETLHRFGYLSD